MPSLTRPYEERDRAGLLAYGEKAGTLDTRENRVLLAEENGEVVGHTAWTWPGLIDPAIPTLGGVVVRESDRRDIFDDLLEAACDAAMAEGHKRGQAFVPSEAFLKLMQDTFKIEAWALGTNTETGKPDNWVIEFDLAENKAILQARRRR